MISMLAEFRLARQSPPDHGSIGPKSNCPAPKTVSILARSPSATARGCPAPARAHGGSGSGEQPPRRTRREVVNGVEDHRAELLLRRPRGGAHVPRVPDLRL